MPFDSDQGATTAELEAELAKLTDELELECAQLEADEDRPIAADPPTDSPPDPEPGTPEADASPSDPASGAPAEPDPAPAEASESDPAEDATASIDAIAQALVDLDGTEEPDGEPESPAAEPASESDDAELDAALQSLVNAESIDVRSSDAEPDDATLDAPPIDLGASRERGAAEEPEGDPETEPRGWEPPDPVAQVESIDRSLADLTAQLMSADDEPSAEPPDEPAAPASNRAQSAKQAAARTRELGVVAAKRAAPAAKAAAKYSAIATRQTIRVAGPPAKAAGLRAARAAAPLGARLLLLASKPMANKPETVRSSVGWLALGTLFIATVTWFFVLVRTPPAPAPTETPAGIRAEGDPPSRPLNEPATDQASGSSASGSGT
ncbi:MAG: hypothetical protein RIB60_02140 [Phycisphaerales bacterium]